MIPKRIHYCWFGGKEKPAEVLRMIASWRKHCPDYEIKEWNESNFDVNMIPYVREAYAAKKYAFVSDYARFWILYKYGGIYFDTDVEVIRRMDDIIERGNFMGMETDADENNSVTGNVAPGLGLGVNPGLGLIKKILDFYETLHFTKETDVSNQITIVHITTKILRDNGLKSINGIQEVDGVWIYPAEYFNPTNITTKRLHITKNTHSIHWYMESWNKKSFRAKIKQFVRSLIPEKLLLKYAQKNKF